MTLKLVTQPDSHGCGPACLAMICGWSYAEAIKLWPKVNFRKSGISRLSLDRALAKLGYAICRREDTRRPFADVHLVEVQTERDIKRKSASWHWVILLRDGTVLDPAETEPQTLDQYFHVRAVAAVVQVCGKE